LKWLVNSFGHLAIFILLKLKKDALKEHLGIKKRNRLKD